MPELHGFDFGQLSFDADEMQVLSISRNENRLELPLTEPPINFSVLRSDFLLSNRWGVSTSKKGDVYIYRRDGPNAEKVSLHASGQHHISITPATAERIGASSRFGPKWNEPEFEREAISTFRLIFPPWGVGVQYQPEDRTKDDLLIVGHRAKLVMVHFFIVESTTTMQSKRPHFVLGKVPLANEKTLYVIAWKQPQNNLMERLQGVFPHISSQFYELGLNEGFYPVSFQGYQNPNSAFMVTVPVHYTPPSGA